MFASLTKLRTISVYSKHTLYSRALKKMPMSTTIILILTIDPNHLVRHWKNLLTGRRAKHSHSCSCWKSQLLSRTNPHMPTGHNHMASFWMSTWHGSRPCWGWTSELQFKVFVAITQLTQVMVSSLWSTRTPSGPLPHFRTQWAYQRSAQEEFTAWRDGTLN